MDFRSFFLKFSPGLFYSLTKKSSFVDLKKKNCSISVNKSLLYLFLKIKDEIYTYLCRVKFSGQSDIN